MLQDSALSLLFHWNEYRDRCRLYIDHNRCRAKIVPVDFHRNWLLGLYLNPLAFKIDYLGKARDFAAKGAKGIAAQCGNRTPREYTDIEMAGVAAGSIRN